ncbi:50S ribosomal protein L4 [Buchnera aphidicola]|uniref:Large ribosomal subunit protein uL4 n=2 Tax=Buchnera aphidicola (Cinara cedri) TaxID=261318 RepID=RL4_BUCCC|nr:50S ribosomal protein L4 [Buchnera aphidicola]Q057A5.1 RecName: Full=Large ribosomal subunit protein uL4; AltName: Full=50S ribosomal protein L4 [Buchnera aphidicola BCc]AAW72706.1 50S ribosomal protein L4 [Buchnera aphidicola (Cinara cedri)]ABJ90794.1 50S ribosomal protein L4 [Buchnera aphidicola BCc]
MELMFQDTNEIYNISESIFNKVFNEPLVHQIIVCYLARRRQGSKAQKSRSEVSGSGKKPWRQKGTGRARSGSLRSPIWRSGGVTFAAKPKKYKLKMNKKMYRYAIKSILSELIRQNRFFLFKEFIIEFPKTKILLKKLELINLKSVLIITAHKNTSLLYASRNLYHVCVINVKSINPVILISYEKVLITLSAIKKIEVMFK